MRAACSTGIDRRGAEQHAICARWLGRKTTPVPERLSPARGYRHDRIRIGYLSSDFCRHAMSFLIAEVFERHDRDRFEVFGYCITLDDGSDIRRRVIGPFDHFVSIRALSDEAAARRIREDEIDILIDLNGLTAGSRLQFCAGVRPRSRRHISASSGRCPCRSWIICSATASLFHATAAAYTPRPLYIAEIYQANDTRRSVGVPTSRANVGLPEDRFVFCCFSNHYKITEAMFAAWMEILAGSATRCSG